MKPDFKHQMSAHCENGVTMNLFSHYGIELSEAMVFGIGSGLFFSYMPFVKLNGLPVSSFRPLPGMIFKKAAKRLKIEYKSQSFAKKETKSMQALDENLKKNIPTGMLVGVFKLTYFPPAYRFHFNAHNIVVFGKEGNKYFISDPVMEQVETLSYDELKTVRFAKGTFKPKGKMYYITNVSSDFPLEEAVKKGIAQTYKYMLNIPFKFFGVKGIKYLAGKVAKWEKKYGKRKAAKYIGQVVRMQEEIGTGGAGFRFLYAAFLQEAGRKLNIPEFENLSKEMTESGDMWREFAIIGGRLNKNRINDGASYQKASEILFKIADKEKEIFTKLKKLV